MTTPAKDFKPAGSLKIAVARLWGNTPARTFITIAALFTFFYFQMMFVYAFSAVSAVMVYVVLLAPIIGFTLVERGLPPLWKVWVGLYLTGMVFIEPMSITVYFTLAQTWLGYETLVIRRRTRIRDRATEATPHMVR